MIKVFEIGVPAFRHRSQRLDQVSLGRIGVASNFALFFPQPNPATHHHLYFGSGVFQMMASITFCSGQRKFSTWESPKSMFSNRLPL